MSDLKEVKNLRHRFGMRMVDCRAAVDGYPDDFPAQFGCLYRRVVGRLSNGATDVVGEPWRREFDALTPTERARMLDVARRPGD